MMMTKVIINVRIDKEDKEKIENLIVKGEFDSISQFIRKAVKDKLKQYFDEKPIVF